MAKTWLSAPQPQQTYSTTLPPPPPEELLFLRLVGNNRTGGEKSCFSLAPLHHQKEKAGLKEGGGAQSLTSSHNSPRWPLCLPSLTSLALTGSLELCSAKHRCSAGPNAPPLPCEEQWSLLQPGCGGLSPGVCLPACRLPADGPAGSDVWMMCASHTHTHSHAFPDVRARPGGAGRWEGSGWSFLS